MCHLGNFYLLLNGNVRISRKGNRILKKIRHIFFILICLCLLAGTAADLVPRAYAASAMTASEACVDFIKAVEGFSPQPYYDYNQYTVGYGTKCPTEKYFEYTANGIPKKEAEVLLRKELAEIEDTLNQKFIDKYNLSFTQHQFDALVSFSYNIGTGWITYDSTLRNAILTNASENNLVYAFGLYCTAGGKYLPGLVTRRLCEANMYLNGIYSRTVNDAFGYVYYDANGGTVTYRVQAFICENNSAPAANAVRSDDVFLGWYTDLTGGTQVTGLNSTVSGQTLFARWQSSVNTQEQNSIAVNIKVTGDVVNIRSGPGTNYAIVSRSYRNEILTVSHVTHLTNMKWGKVQDGWICLDYTNYDAVMDGTDNTDVENNDSTSDTDTAPDQEENRNEENTDVYPGDQDVVLGIVNVNNYLIIREGPDRTYPAVGFLFKDNIVEILEQKSVGSMVWGRIKDGWVCMDYIITDSTSADGNNESITEQEPENSPAQNPENDTNQSETDTANKAESVSITGKITADALRIRSAAGTANPIVGFYYQNDRVAISRKVLVDSVYWGKTEKGWISMDYVLADSSEESVSPPVENEIVTIIADCLRIRKEAGTEHKIVAFLYYGDTATILETKDVDGTLWGRVFNGWICMDYVR